MLLSYKKTMPEHRFFYWGRILFLNGGIRLNQWFAFF